MKTETPQDIENEIMRCSDSPGDLRLRQFIMTLKRADQETIVEGIVRVFERNDRSETSFRDQEFAGKILQDLNPKSSMDLEKILRRTLTNWNKSVEQFPFWLRDNYGLNSLKIAFSTIDLTPAELDKIETMKFWLQMKANA